VDAASKNGALGYETYLRQQRGKGPKWWEVPGPIVSAALLLGGTILFGGLRRLFGWFYPWTAVEWAAVPINAFLSFLVIKVTAKMVRRRRDIGTKVASPPTPSSSPH
jgi:hypothetical protein